VSGDLLPVVVGIALVAAAAVFVLMPFSGGNRLIEAPVAEPEGPDRFQLYRQVLELEFDRDLGKLSAEDYEHLSNELLARAGQALQEERGSTSELDDEIEREIAAARKAFAAARKPTKTKRPAGTPS
jgi:hypothetical protein